MIGKTSRAVAMKHSRADGAADQINRLIIASSLTVINPKLKTPTCGKYVRTSD